MGNRFRLARTAVPGVVLSLLVLLTINALGESGDTFAKSGRGPLDGMIFEGMIGPRENPDKKDELHFNDGQFWSAICVECGFEPGEYWVRYEGDDVHFRGEMSGERGTFTYDGIISEDEIDVSIEWRKERWYWTIERELRFHGTLVERVSETPAVNAKRIASEMGDNAPPGCL